METHRCRNYLCLDCDVKELYNLQIPADGFDLLLEVLSFYDLDEDGKLLELLKKSIPVSFNKESLNKFFVDNEELVEELISKGEFMAAGTLGEFGFGT